MPSFFQNLQDKFKQFKESEFFTRRNIIVGITLIVLALSLYPGIKLIEDQRILRSRAEGDLCETDPENDQNWEKTNDGECTECNLRSNTYRNVCTQELKDFTDEDESCNQKCTTPPTTVNCSASLPCAVDSNTPICDSTSNTCRSCRNGDSCGGNYSCEAKTGRCISNSGTQPSPATGTCVVDSRQNPNVGNA